MATEILGIGLTKKIYNYIGRLGVGRPFVMGGGGGNRA